MKECLIGFLLWVCGSLIGINVCLLWFLGIHMTTTEARVRHLELSRATVRAELLICADRVRGAVNDVLEEVGEMR